MWTYVRSKLPVLKETYKHFITPVPYNTDVPYCILKPCIDSFEQPNENLTNYLAI